MEGFSNSDLFKGINGQNLEALNHLYSSFFPKIYSMIKGLGGQESDANDIFQEAIIIFYRKAKRNEVDGTTQVLPYLMTTCKYIWLKTIRDDKNRKNEEYPSNLSDENLLFQEYVDSKKRELMYRHFKLLQPDCKKIIKAYYSGMSYKEITDKMGFSSEEYAKRKKYLCKDFLVKSIKGDPEYKDIFD